jgi:hypothetical protein
VLFPNCNTVSDGFKHGRVLFPNGATPSPLSKSVLLRRGYALAPSPTASNKAACCFQAVQHLVRLLYWLLLRRGPSPTVSAWPRVVSKRRNTVSDGFSMAACCFQTAQHRVQLLRLLLPMRGYALAQQRAVWKLCVVARGSLRLFRHCCFVMVQPSPLSKSVLLRRGPSPTVSAWPRVVSE